MSQEPIKNEVSTTGLVVCVVCNKPSTWRVAKGVTYTSPMRRVKVRNLDALVHECCLPKLYASMKRQLTCALWKSRIRDIGRAAGNFIISAVFLFGYYCVYPFFLGAYLVRSICVKRRKP